MKNFSIIIFIPFVFFSTLCFAQRMDWSPEQIITLFKDAKDTLKTYDERHPFKEIKDGTLSLGKWKGKNWGVFHTDDFTLTITQTSPNIKGTFELVVQTIEAQDTLRGIIRGINSINRIILALKYTETKEHYDFLEGETFIIIPNGIYKMQVFSGIIEDAHLKNPSKELFLLYKE